MIIGKSFALWKENRSPKATDNNKKGIWGKLREREREREKNLIDDQVLPTKNAVPPVTTEDEII
jgi:hypothetical protein